MNIIELNEHDMTLAILMGLRRNGIKQTAGIRTNGYDGDDAAIHVLGATGEVAVARLFGVKPDRSILLGGDGGVDLRLRGATWDVKTRGSINKDLLIRHDLSDFRADFCVLCWRFAPDRIGVVGYVSRRRFIELAYPVQARGPRLCLPWQQLTAFDERGFKNANREVVWFSPHSLNSIDTLPLFAHTANSKDGRP